MLHPKIHEYFHLLSTLIMKYHHHDIARFSGKPFFLAAKQRLEEFSGSDQTTAQNLPDQLLSNALRFAILSKLPPEEYKDLLRLALNRRDVPNTLIEAASAVHNYTLLKQLKNNGAYLELYAEQLFRNAINSNAPIHEVKKLLALGLSACSDNGKMLRELIESDSTSLAKLFITKFKEHRFSDKDVLLECIHLATATRNRTILSALLAWVDVTKLAPETREQIANTFSKKETRRL